MRLGGIYTLERVARESPGDYWTVMETLPAFVRERARWIEPDVDTIENDALEPPELPTDIAAVLAVIARRPVTERDREKSKGRRLDLRGTDLRGASLYEVHLEDAILIGTHLEHARLSRAHLERASLSEAHLEGAHLDDAHLGGSILIDANLEGADLSLANLTVRELVS